MIGPDPFHADEIRFRRRLLAGAIFCGAVAAIVFSFAPDLDLMASRAVRLCAAGNEPLGWCTAPLQGLRMTLMWVGIAIAVALGVLAAVHASQGTTAPVDLRRRQFAYAAIALLAGPLLVTNAGFKDHWGRARPRDVIEFGGTKTFTPALQPTSQCERNCSFVSGEASSMFMPFFVAAILIPRRRALIVGGGVAAGLAAGLVRMSQGGHFLSDVIFAGVFMALTASLLHIVMLERGVASKVRESG